MKKGMAGFLAACLALAAFSGDAGRAENEMPAEEAGLDMLAYAESEAATDMADIASDETESDMTGYAMGEAEEDAEPVSAVTPPATFRLLQKGSRGDDVKALQLRLQELGYDPGTADGIYGSGTKEAVKAFQKRNSLSADGAAGQQTQTRLYAADALGPLPPPEPADVLAGEWPMLTNLQYPVGESFVPADLVRMTDFCDPGLIRIKYPETEAVRTAVEALAIMLEAARADGITKWQCSAAYRSYAAQEKLLNNKINTYLKKNADWSRSRARRAALKSVAEPGASEHHLGLAFDVNVPGTSAFAGTKQCAWLHANCWEYGFIVRYPEGKQAITGFTPEAWHIRYVGREHAMKMWEEDLCLEEYLERYQPAEAESAGDQPMTEDANQPGTEAEEAPGTGMTWEEADG